MKMKNRIISLLLVVVSCVLLLTGCAFNYQKSDLTEYATFDVDAFKALLGNVEVEDSDFRYDDEEVRAKMVSDEIYSRLVNLAEADDKVFTGTLAEKNILYYCYYVTATFAEKIGDTDETEDKTYTFYATNMTESKFQTLALYNLTKDVDKKIMEALLGDTPFVFDEAAAYVTKTDGTTAGGKVVYVTYKATDTAGTTVTYTNERIVLPAEDDGTFAGYLVGKEIATTLEDKDITVGEGDDAVTTKYTDIKVNWMVDAGKEVVIDFEENPFTSTTSQTADNGTKKDLKDANSVSYHIYPVGRQEVEELTKENGKLVFTTLLGDGISTTSLDCLSKEEYKYTDGETEVTIKSLVEELAGKYKALSEAKTAYDKAPANETLQQNYEDAKAAVAAAALDEYWNKMQQCAGEDDLSEVMYNEYTEDVYDELESDYNDEMADKIAVALWDMIQQAVTNVVAPERALKDAYKHNNESFKYDYYTGSVSTDTNAATNLETYATYKDYLVARAKEIATEELGMSAVVCENYEQAVAILEDYAEKQVKEYIIIWTVAKAFDIEVVDTEVENFALLQSYYMQLYGLSITSDQIIEQYGEENIRTYLVFDKLISHFLEVEEDDEETDEDESLGGTAFKNITVVRIVPQEDEENTEGDENE